MQVILCSPTFVLNPISAHHNCELHYVCHGNESCLRKFCIYRIYRKELTYNEWLFHIYTANMFFSFKFTLNLIICQASLEDFVQFVNKI